MRISMSPVLWHRKGGQGQSGDRRRSATSKDQELHASHNKVIVKRHRVCTCVINWWCEFSGDVCEMVCQQCSVPVLTSEERYEIGYAYARSKEARIARAARRPRTSASARSLFIA